MITAVTSVGRAVVESRPDKWGDECRTLAGRDFVCFCFRLRSLRFAGPGTVGLVLFHWHGHRFALIDNMHSKELEGLVAGNLKARVWYVTHVDVCATSCECHIFAVQPVARAAFNHVEGFFAGMSMERYRRSAVNRADSAERAAP
jgi:hypothetical protein